MKNILNLDLNDLIYDKIIKNEIDCSESLIDILSSCH